MRHHRYRVQSLRVDQVAVEVGWAGLVVVAHEGNDHLDWELVVRSREPLPLPRGPYALEMGARAESEPSPGGGAALRGPAVLVRSDGRAHVFRGAGRLEGLPREPGP